MCGLWPKQSISEAPGGFKVQVHSGPERRAVDHSCHPRRQRCKSWACSQCARVLGRRLLDRLDIVVEKAAAVGLRVAMVSLTLDRGKWPDGPVSAWRRLRELRAVPRAVKAFCLAYGIPFRHRYVIKMELQRAGWVHWHVLVLVPQAVQLPIKGAFDRFWKWGFSNVQQGGSVYAYLCKYACKEAGSDGMGALDASGLPGRYVHWLQPSRGFWREWGLSDFDERVECCEYPDEVADDDGEPEESHAERVERCRSCTVLDVEVGGGKTWRCVLPLRRSTVAEELERVGRGVRTFDSGVVESVILNTEGVGLFLERMGAYLQLMDWYDFCSDHGLVGLGSVGAAAGCTQPSARHTTRSEATACYAESGGTP